MKGYLLDTNHVTAWENQGAIFIERLSALPQDSMPRVCAITAGEIEAGHRITETTNQTRRDEFNRFVVRELHPRVIPVGIQTRIYYGQIVARLWDRHRPPPRRRTEMHLATLGIDINDLWIVAVAWEHGLTLLTTDSMDEIRKVVPEVEFDSWC